MSLGARSSPAAECESPPPRIFDISKNHQESINPSMIRRPSVRPPVPVTSFMTNMPCARFDVWQEEELFLLNLKKQEAADEPMLIPLSLLRFTWQLRLL